MDTQTLTRLENLEELFEGIKAEDLDSLARCERARLEQSFWDVWRWRRRIRRGSYCLHDARSSTALEAVDTLVAYAECQRDIIHRMLRICADAAAHPGKKSEAPKVYNRLCSAAERYLKRKVDGSVLRHGAVHRVAV